MVASTEVLDAYRRLWQEVDETERRRLAEICLATGVEYSAQGVTRHGRDGFLAYVADHQESGNKRTFPEDAEQHNEQILLRWEQPDPDGSGTLNGADYGEVDTQGLFKRISSFLTERVKKKGLIPSFETWAKENPIQALGLAGGILYTLLRVPLSVFYMRLGLTPEDVGFSNVTILLQSFSIYIVAFLVFTLVVVILGTPLVFPVQLGVGLEKRRHPGATRWQRFKRLDAPLLLPGTLVLLLLLIFIQRPDVTTKIMIWSSILAFAFYCVWPYVAIWFLYRRQFDLRKEMAPQRRKTISELPISFLKLLLAYALLALLLAPWTAYTDAENVRDGNTLQDSPVPRPWRAPPVQASWIDKVNGMDDLPGCENLRFLGSTDKSLVFFDWHDKDVYRIQPDKVTLRIKDSKDDCPAEVLQPPTDIQVHRVWTKGASVHYHFVAPSRWAMTDFIVRQPYVRSIEVKVTGVQKVKLSLIRSTSQGTWKRVISRKSIVKKGRARVIFKRPVDARSDMNRYLFLQISNITSKKMKIYFTTHDVNKNVKGYLWCNRPAPTCIHRGEDLNAVVVGWKRPR
jgi:hypothetical protein